MKLTIYVFKKPGAYEKYGTKPKVFNTWHEAHEHACSHECSVNRTTFEITTPYDVYIKEVEIEV